MGSILNSKETWKYGVIYLKIYAIKKPKSYTYLGQCEKIRNIINICLKECVG